jgi:hypothetical protein
LRKRAVSGQKLSTAVYKYANVFSPLPKRAGGER